MPQYAYRAKDQTRNVVEGTIEADSETVAINRLGSRGMYPLTITEATGVRPFRFGRARRVSARARAHMTRQLADLLGGGLPLLGALTLLAKQTEHPTLRGVVEALTSAVREGHSLSSALADHPEVFPPLYISMVRAGEVGGMLEPSLARLAELGEHEAELRSQLLSASAYPLFVLMMAVVMTAFLLTYVVPTLSTVFWESGQVLPLPTRILMTVSGIFTRWWWALAAALLLAAWGARRWYARPAGKAAVDRFVVRLPGIGLLIRKLETERLVRNLGMLIGQGVPVLQALDVVGRHLSNVVLRDAVAQMQEAVQGGSSLAEALRACGQFPVFVDNMVSVGEEAGTVDTALNKVAVTYEREADRTIRTLTTILEPILLVVVGGVVMFIVLAMLLPIFQIGLIVQ